MAEGKQRGILVDVTQCIGCGECYRACQEANGQPPHENPEKFDESTFTYLLDLGNDTFVRRLCMHCFTPTCVSVCPVTALEKTEKGPVTYDPEKCMGCRYCMMACPFGVPTYEWHSAMPRIRKCEMCSKRGDAGPACAEACPTGATITGELEGLIADSERRLRESPSTYFPHVYGSTEVGGTSVRYPLPKSPKEMGLPTNLPTDPLPLTTWTVLKHVPDIAIFGGILLGGLWWLTNRKYAVTRDERERRRRIDDVFSDDNDKG